MILPQKLNSETASNQIFIPINHDSLFSLRTEAVQPYFPQFLLSFFLDMGASLWFESTVILK